MLDTTGYLAVLATTGARLERNVQKLLDDAHASGLVRVNEFREYVEALNSTGVREGESPVESNGAARLMTVHRAKGLQFPVVVLADASRASPHMTPSVLWSAELGLVPQLSRSPQTLLALKLASAAEREMDAAEELRLLYVAATRAQEKLIVCGHEMGRWSDVWLKKLVKALGQESAFLTQSPNAWQTIRLAECGQPVGVLGAEMEAPPALADPPEESIALPALHEPLFRPLVTLSRDEEAAVPVKARARSTRPGWGAGWRVGTSNDSPLVLPRRPALRVIPR